MLSIFVPSALTRYKMIHKEAELYFNSTTFDDKISFPGATLLPVISYRDQFGQLLNDENKTTASMSCFTG